MASADLPRRLLHRIVRGRITKVFGEEPLDRTSDEAVDIVRNFTKMILLKHAAVVGHSR